MLEHRYTTFTYLTLGELMPRRVRKTTERDGIIHSYRKVVRHSDSLMISLPKAWAEEHGIKAGDEMAITANNILSAVKRVKKE